MPTFQSKTMIAVTLAFTSLVSATAGYCYAHHEANMEALQGFYFDRAQDARVDAMLLTYLRSGSTDKAIKLLSGLMEGELVSLDSYEQNIAQAQRSPKVYENVAAVRAYYDRFPAVERPTYGKEGLALKRP